MGTLVGIGIGFALLFILPFVVNHRRRRRSSDMPADARLDHPGYHYPKGPDTGHGFGAGGMWTRP